MKSAVTLILLLALLIIASPASVKGQTGTPASWNKKVDCYGPFPAAPILGQTGYNKTESDTFNATLNGQNMGGVALTCGPVLQGMPKQSVSGQFPVTANSTDLHWHELDSTIPQASNPLPSQGLDLLFSNMTEAMYVNGHLFANLTLQFAPFNSPYPPSAGANLTCFPSVYPWNFVLNVSWIFTNATGGSINTNPSNPQVSCSTSKSTTTFAGYVLNNHYYDFHLDKQLNATYTASNQPSDLNETTALNRVLLDTAYIHFIPATTPAVPTFPTPIILLTIGAISGLLTLIRPRRTQQLNHQ